MYWTLRLKLINNAWGDNLLAFPQLRRVHLHLYSAKKKKCLRIQTFIFGTELAKALNPSYLQFGRISWANSLVKGHPIFQPLLKTLHTVKLIIFKQASRSSKGNYFSRIVCQFLTTSWAHFSLYCVFLGLDCVNNASSSSTLARFILT